MLNEHRNPRFNIVQVGYNDQRFYVIHGQRERAGYPARGAVAVSEPMTRDEAIALADRLEALGGWKRWPESVPDTDNPPAATSMLSRRRINAEGRLTAEQRIMVEHLRAAGFAVVIFTSTELGRADPRALEADLVEAGNGIIDTINSIKE